jgi:uncharacterized protein HemX
MKKTILTLAAAATLIIGTTFTGCKSSAQKEDAAQANVQEAKQELKEVRREATAEEWNEFKSETDLKIEKNETRIAELKEKIKKQGKSLDALYEKKVDQLEQKNRDLKAKMETYGESKHSDWESFKREFNHDMDELGAAFKDLTVNNKD